MMSIRTAAVCTALGIALCVPAAHADFRCRSVRSIRLQPDPSAPFQITGRAEIDQCYGMSFLRVTVQGNVPDGTGLTPAFQSLEPYLGNTFYTMSHRGDGVSGPDGIFDNPAGRTLVLFDDAFNPIASATF